MLTLVWTITYRMDSKSPQKEVKKYTKESAELMAANIMELGGLAVVTENTEEDSNYPDEDPSESLFSQSRNRLNWS